MTVVKKLFTIASGLAVSVLVTRYLGADLRGVYAYIISSASIAVVLLNFGVTLNYQSVRRQQGDEAIEEFTSYSLSIFTLLIIGLLIPFYLFGIYSDESMIAIVTAAMVLRLQLGHYNLIENINIASRAVILSGILELAIILAAYFFAEKSVILVVIAVVCKNLLTAVIAYSALSNSSGSFILPSTMMLWPNAKARSQFFAGLKPFFLTVAIMLNYRIDVLFLWHMGVEEGRIGIFALGVFIAETIWIITDVFKDVQTKRTSQGGEHHEIAKSIRLSIFFTTIACIGYVVLGHPATVLFFGQEFAESYAIAILMLAATFFMIFCKLIGVYYITNNSIGLYLSLMILAVVVNCLLNLFLIPHAGIYGAVAASSVSYIVPGLILLIDFGRKHEVPVGDLLFVNRNDLASITARFSRIGK